MFIIYILGICLYGISFYRSNKTSNKFITGGGKTDALTAIDVNTGSAKRFDTNREAIQLISKLIKLKNISGKVVIDPVASDQNTLRKLVGMLKNEFRDDLSITNVYGYTRGGLLELSRSRNDRSIDELNLQ